MNNYRFVEEIFSNPERRNILEDFYNEHLNSILPKGDLIKISKKKILVNDLILNENINIKNNTTRKDPQYILDHRLYLFLNIKDIETAFVIREMKLNTEFATLRRNVLIEEKVNYYEDFVLEIFSSAKIKKNDTTEAKFPLILNSVFFVIRYQKENTNNFFDSLFILNSKYFNLESDGFEVREILSSEIQSLRNLFLSLFVKTTIKENKEKEGKYNPEYIIKDNLEKHNMLLTEDRLSLQDNLSSSLNKTEYKNKVYSFLMNSNKHETLKFIEKSKEYIDELNSEISGIKKNIQKKEEGVGLQTILKKNGFMKNTLFVFLIFVCFVLLFVLMFNKLDL